MVKFLRGFNFVYWVLMIIFGVVYIVTDFHVEPVNFMLMAVCGLFEYMNRAIRYWDKED